MAALHRSAAALVLAIAVSGCSSGILGGLWGDDTSSTSTRAAAAAGSGVTPDMTAAGQTEAVGELYNKGLASLNDQEYKTAIKHFSEVERQYPYSALATKAILMQAFSHYQRSAFDDAINSSNRFITLHPGHRDAPYAYYLIALSNYDRIADVKRDQTSTQKALESLEEISRRFPGTPYAADAEKKVLLAKDHLAGKEMEVGRYYLNRGSYLAGINRFKRVVTDYQTTSQTPEALYRLAEGYMALGVTSEAQTAAAVLGHNYPNSQWYKDAYTLVASDGQQPVENEESWISKAFRTLNPL